MGFFVFREIVMKHATQAQFGRSMAAVQMKINHVEPSADDANQTDKSRNGTPQIAAQTSGLIDKWDALKVLSDAAPALCLSHRTLSVLKTLLTFLPERLIRPEHRSAIVFPSNKTLSDRLNGMPDSTLRRHLATLVSAGIVSRHDSANRKRFARYGGSGARCAFGLDLSPLARRHAEFAAQAQIENQRKEALQCLRAETAHLRQALLQAHGPCPLTDDAFKLLRRQPNGPALNAMRSSLQERLDQKETEKVNTSDVQNERHKEKNFIINSVSQDRSQNCENQGSEDPKASTAHQSQTSTQTSLLEKTLRKLNAFSEYFPEPIRHWNDLVSIADKLTRMMGIDGSVFKEAIVAMGAKHASIAILSILENFAQIKNPGGYLRRLTQAAQIGRFDVHSLIK